MVYMKKFINENINNRKLVEAFYDESSEIFGSSSKEFVLSEYQKMLNAFTKISFDKFYTNISKDDKCLFIYAIKGETKLFFNLFFDKNTVEALVNISTPGGKQVLSGDIENCISEMSEMFLKD